MNAARVAMSGEDDREAKKRAQGEDAGGARPPPRARRVKPPPGIMTAGGMDMARAHASGISVRGNNGPDPAVDEPRVVLSDGRKVPTGPRLRGGRSPEDERAALLPVPPDEATVATRAPASPAPAQRRPAWAPLALFAAMLLAGVALGHRAGRAPEPPPEPSPIAVVLPPEPPAPEAPAPLPEATPEPEAPPAPLPEAALAPEPPAPPPPRAARAPVAAPAKPAFTPPFELPSRKGGP
jgi:hypothetical protein